MGCRVRQAESGDVEHSDDGVVGFAHSGQLAKGQGEVFGFYEKTGWSRSGNTKRQDFGDGSPAPLVEYRIDLQDEHRGRALDDGASR